MKVTKQISLLLVAVMVIWLSVEGKKAMPTLIRYDASFTGVFDTQTEIIGYGTSKKAFQIQATQLKNKLTFYHQLFDIYHSYTGLNNMKTINDNAGIKPVKVNDAIIQLLKLSKQVYEETNGQINVAMGSVLSIWHEYREEGIRDPGDAKLPSSRELEHAADHMNLDKVIIDEDEGTVFLADPDMSLDVGSIGKGFAVQKVTDYAKSVGISNLLISVGGNVSVLGVKQDGTNFRLGIENPDLSSKNPYVQKVSVTNCSVVTSGNYQRYYIVDGIRYCHIIDPDTLMPSNEFSSVTIIAPDSGMADAFSTAVFNMSLDEGMRLINRMDQVEAMWINEDGSIHYSKGFSQYLEGGK